MLSERELKLLAQIEAHFRAEEPALARLLSEGGRWMLLRRLEPGVLRGLLAVMTIMLVGAGMAVIGGVIGNAILLALGLTGAIVLPLPAWLIGSSPRSPGRPQPA